MAKLLPEVITALKKTSPVCIATSTKDGVPNINYVSFISQRI